MFDPEVKCQRENCLFHHNSILYFRLFESINNRFLILNFLYLGKCTNNQQMGHLFSMLVV